MVTIKLKTYNNNWLWSTVTVRRSMRKWHVSQIKIYTCSADAWKSTMTKPANNSVEWEKLLKNYENCRYSYFENPIEISTSQKFTSCFGVNLMMSNIFVLFTTFHAGQYFSHLTTRRLMMTDLELPRAIIISPLQPYTHIQFPSTSDPVHLRAFRVLITHVISDRYLLKRFCICYRQH